MTTSGAALQRREVLLSWAEFAKWVACVRELSEPDELTTEHVTTLSLGLIDVQLGPFIEFMLRREVRDVTPEAVSEAEQALEASGFRRLCEAQHVLLLVKHVTSALEAQLRQDALPAFLEALSRCPPALPAAAAGATTPTDDASVSGLEDKLHEALQGLCRCMLWHLQVLAIVAGAVRGSGLKAPLVASAAGMQAAHVRTLRALLLPEEPFNLCHLLERYYASKLEQFKMLTSVAMESLLTQSHSGLLPVSPNASLHACLMDVSPPGYAGLPDAWVSKMLEITQHLERIGLEAQAHDAISAVIHNDLHDTLMRIGRMYFHMNVLQPAQQYVRRAALEFLRLLLHSNSKIDDALDELKQWSQRLQFYVYDTIGRLYIEHMFEITLDFPDSLPAVEDMCSCLTYTNLHSRFVETLRSSIRRRLLHAGSRQDNSTSLFGEMTFRCTSAEYHSGRESGLRSLIGVATDSILEAYIAAMKVLRNIDSSGNLLEAIAEPIKAYLRSRPDTIHCVVKMLTQDSASSNGESLLSDMRNSMDCSLLGLDYDDLEGVENVVAEAESWEPVPVELDNETLATHASFDIIATLVDIYGDADFVNEYKRMLANKLLKNRDYSTAYETRTLELLKLRFAESELHHCDVMLKDMQVSRRLNLMLNETNALRGTAEASHLATVQHRLNGVSVLVCSYLFWPRLPVHEIAIPRMFLNLLRRCAAGLQDSLKAHAEMFQLLKTPRKLNFQASLGIVDLDITVGDVVLHFAVSPILTVIILQFVRAQERTASSLATSCNLPLELLLRKALFWVQHGALSEARLPTGELMYRRNETLPDNITVTDAVIKEDVDEEDHAPARPAHRKVKHDMEPYLPVINNILLSGHTVALERMHKLLTLFCAHHEPKYTKTEDELLGYLDVLVEKGHLKCERSLYSFKHADKK